MPPQLLCNLVYSTWRQELFLYLVDNFLKFGHVLLSVKNIQVRKASLKLQVQHLKLLFEHYLYILTLIFYFWNGSACTYFCSMVLCVGAPSATQEEMFDKDPAFNLIFGEEFPFGTNYSRCHYRAVHGSIVLWWIHKQGILGVLSTAHEAFQIIKC